ncbi:hypothetical protein ACR0ST_06240 [Aliidiomarina sp. Khilg15.8]
MMKTQSRQQRSGWLSLSNILYAVLTLVALVLFTSDAQAFADLPAFFLHLQ